MIRARTKYYYLLLSLLGALVVAAGVLAAAPPAQAQEPITVDKECTPNPVQVGQQLICAIAVDPASPGSRGVVTARDTLPPSVTVTGATQQILVDGVPGLTLPCSVTGNLVQCPTQIVSGPPRAVSIRITVDAIAQECGTFTNTAEAFVFETGNITPATEEFTVVGCEGAAPGAAPGAGGGGPVTLETENEAQSGAVDLAFEVSNEGDYASQCVPALQFGNSGNFNDAPGFLQFGSGADDFEPGGIEFSVEPEQDVGCDSAVQQSSSGASG